MKDEPGGISYRTYRWIVFLLLAIGYLLVYFHRLCPAVVALDLMNDLKASGSLVGLLASAYFYPYALMQIPSGLLSDSWGPRKTITGFFILAGVASIFFGLAQSAVWAIAARVLVGIGVSMLFVPIMKILTRWFTVSEFSFMTGILMAVGGLGALTAATPLAFISTVIGWRGSFIVIGMLTIVTAVGIWMFVRNSPQEKGYPPVAMSDSPQQKSPSKMSLVQGMAVVLKSFRFWMLALWFFFTFGIFFSFAGLWGGPYLMEVYRLDKGEAGDVLSVISIAMIVGSPLLGFLSDRIFRSRKKILVVSAACVVVLMIPLVFADFQLGIPALYGWSFCLGVFGSAVVVIGFSTAKELFPVEIAGTAVGMINFFPFLGGAIAQPSIGAVLDAYGKLDTGYSLEAYRHAFLIYFAAALLAFAAACLTKETLPKSMN